MKIENSSLVRCLNCTNSLVTRRKFNSDPAVITCSISGKKLVGNSLRKCSNYIRNVR